VGAALNLHARVEQEEFPPGFDVRLRVAVAVGDATPDDGIYTGAVVDHVVGLRSAAAPGTTITSERTAELLANLDGLVGHVVSIVPLGEVDDATLPRGTCAFGLTRPGDERSARLRTARTIPSIVTATSTPTIPASPTTAPPNVTVDKPSAAWGPPAAPTGTPSAERDEPTRAAERKPVTVDDVRRRTALSETLQEPSTLVMITAVGCAWIFFIVLSGEFRNARGERTCRHRRLGGAGHDLRTQLFAELRDCATAARC
jgi:hypothetical protein